MVSSRSVTYLLPPPGSNANTSLPRGSADSSEERQRQKQSLINLARTFIRDGNRSEYIHLNQFAPECRVTHQGCADMTLEEFIQLHKNMKAAYPAYHVEPLSESVDVDLEERRATVWMRVTATGIPEGVTREGLALWKFRLDRKSGDWLCCHHGAFEGCNELVSSDLER